MYFKFACGECGKNLKVRPEHAGRKVSCPYCRAQIVIPQPEDAVDEIEEYVDPSVSSTPRPAARRPSVDTSASSGDAWADGTNVSALLSCGIGVAVTIVFFVLLLPFSSTYFGELFIKGDTGWWVPPALMFLMSWAVAILFLKSRKLKRQKESMLLDLLPTELAHDITVDHVDHFVDHVRKLPAKPGESFLVNRVLRGLEHFRVRRSAAEVSTVMASQSEIDANSVDSSYTMLKVFIWAIPILGFIGTVIGISAAVGGFSGTLETSDDISALKDSLNNVTGGLATAFDTTLVALVMSMLIMFPTSSMQKSEEDLLNWVDEYCNENLLKRLDDGRGGIDRSAGIAPGQLRQLIDAALVGHHAELKAWSKKLESIGGTLTEQVTQGWSEVQEQVKTQQKQTAAKMQQIDAMADQFQTSIADMSTGTATTQQEVADNMRASAEAVREYVDDLQRGLQGLSDVLADLGQYQVVVQQTPRRGWFSFGRKNGGKDDQPAKKSEWR